MRNAYDWANYYANEVYNRRHEGVDDLGPRAFDNLTYQAMGIVMVLSRMENGRERQKMHDKLFPVEADGPTPLQIKVDRILYG